MSWLGKVFKRLYACVSSDTGIALEFLDGMTHGLSGIAEGAICNEGGRIDD